jgi:hypothetical protein
MIGPSAKRTTVGACPAATCARNAEISKHSASGAPSNRFSIVSTSFSYYQLLIYFIARTPWNLKCALFARLYSPADTWPFYKDLHPWKTKFTLWCV